jgi:NitT/TauT family transport system permease protein
MDQNRILNAVYPIVTFAVIFVLWEAACRMLHVPTYYIPAPSKILMAAINGADIYIPNLWVTLYSTVLAFGIAFVLGVAVGTIISEFVTAEKILMPVLVALQSMPRVALAPIIIVWFGFGPESKIVLGAFTAFFPVFLNTAQGMRQVDTDQMALMRSLRATRLQIFFKIKLPSAMPYLMAGASIGVVFAMLAVIVGEFLGANMGMGYLIVSQSTQMDTAGVMATTFILSIVGMAFHYGLQFLRDHLLAWSSQNEIAGSSI